MMKQKIRLMIMIVLVTCTAVIHNVDVNAASAKSGYCGAEGSEKNVKWSYNDGILTISGNGAMEDYRKIINGADVVVDQPWKSFMSKVKKVQIQEGVTYVGSDAFFNCKNLETVFFPDSLVSIGNFAFMNCAKLKQILFPTNLQSLGQQCFAGCTTIKTVSIPDSITFIDGAVFEGCTSLTTAYIGGKKNVASFICGNSPFRLCTSLEKIEVSEDNVGLKSVNGVLYNKDQTVLIQYPLGKKGTEYTVLQECKDVFTLAFENAVYLEEIHLPEGLQLIRECAICGCSQLKYLIIPSSVLNIEGGLGDNCTNLKYIENLSSVEIKVPYIEGKIGVNADGKTVSCIGANETVNIVDNSASVSKKIKSIKNQTVKIKSIKNKKSKKIVLKLSGKGKGTGYQIQYAKNKKFKSAKKVTRKTSTITLSKLTKKKKYYVRVRVYGKVNGKTYYGKWSKVKSVTVRK